MFLRTTMAMSVTLAIVVGTGSGYEHDYASTASSSALIAFVYVFAAISAFGFTPMQSCYPTEVLATDMRAKGFGLFHIVSGAAGFLNDFVAPLVLANIKFWFYVFFVFWDLLEFRFIYLFLVETKGRTLDEFDLVFEAEDPRKASTKVCLIQHG